MEFINTEHSNNYYEFKGKVPLNSNEDRGLNALAYIISSDLNLKEKLMPYINWNKTFDYNKMKSEQVFTATEKVLVDVAIDLYNDEGKVKFVDIFKVLNADQQKVVNKAAKYRYNPQNPYHTDSEVIYIK